MARMSEKVLLPSKGIPYGGKIPAELTVQNLTVDELSYLMSSTAPINDILNSCIVEDIDVSRLIVQDKHFLLIKARVLTWGHEYPIYPKCTNPNCRNSEFKYVVNLNRLPVFELDDDFETEWEVELPISKDKIIMRLPIGETYDEGEEYIRQKLARYPMMDEARLRYKVDKCMCISKINGEEMSLNDLVQYVGELHAMDGEYLDHKLSKIEVGYDTLVVAECPQCHEQVKVRLGLSADFFRAEFDD